MGSAVVDAAFTGGHTPLTVNDWLVASAQEDHGARLLDHVQSFNEQDPAWICIVPQDHVRRQWQRVESLRAKGLPLPLCGVPFAVKDNIDVAGLPTTAACPDFAYVPSENASVVQTLMDAGAVVVGKCNLDAFATGLVGTRSPFGAVPNTYDERYVSGGSSSGSASVVARGLVPFSLGTDTAGSGRVPAGLNNIVGLKATRGALSACGVVPACRSLDCVSMFTLTLSDARLVFDTACAYDPADGYSRLATVYPPPVDKVLRFAICDNPPWFDREFQSDAYLNALQQTQPLGWQLQPTDFSALFKLAALLYEGPWVAERYAAIKDFIETPSAQIDPVVRGIIEKARNFSATDLFACEYLRKDLTRIIETRFRDFDAIIVPTTPTFPTLEQLKTHPVIENSLLGTYTNFVNFLDWSAISIPAGFRADGLPFGLTFISTRWQEQKLFHLAEQYLKSSQRRLGATMSYYQDFQSPQKVYHDHSLVIVGAHLTGFPLNYQLIEAGATLDKVATTAKSYRLYELPSSTKIRKPGLKRVFSEVDQGCSIEVEVWNISNQGLGALIKSIPPPLGIGSVELEDGTWVKGFVCEPWGFHGARDITEFGGWRHFIQSESAKDTIRTSTIEPPSKKKLNSVLIANRGEIAVRIIRALKKLGIRSIAIYSSEDSRAQHVTDAEESYFLKGITLEETYLSRETIVQLAKSCGAEAIIPGYGFLSESAAFAQDCEDSGLIWIGPTPQQMRQLGLKHLARELAQQSNVPLLPGTGLVADVDTAVAEAAKISYPVIIKSSAGGGGIGLQHCDDQESLLSAFGTMQHLGQSYFNDSRVFIEKFVKNARHVEVQIIGDGKGLVKHVGERDCSLQRRKQKVIEESPAIFVPIEIRQAMRKAAINLTSSVNYRGVGTVEFIYDLDEKTFCFLEVNTRLQVEHCVTEEVFGLDLVEAMVRVASGDADYIFSTKDFSPRQVSLEARIYGESPLQTFRPSPGEILDVSFPAGVRIDTWISPGTVVSPSYDPLLAKLIVSGFDRPDAIRRLAVALRDTKITGIETNLAYLQQIVDSKLFTEGSYTTTSLDQFQIKLPAIEVLESGPSTAVQDYPGRVGKWSVGIPPSGPMDDYSFRLANKVLDNEIGAAGLECTSAGPILLFHHDVYVAVVGAPASLFIDDFEAEYGKPILVSSGQTLKLGTFKSGSRAYIAVKGGIQVPKVLRSRSTFALGKTGGHCGRALRVGDIIPFAPIAESIPIQRRVPKLPEFTSSWTLRVLPGPHAYPDFVTESGFKEFFESPWKVHYNSNRVGIRLNGPKPKWARDSGGEAGLHPSNIHDSPYSIGSISFTGDQAVILTCDGPSLGGFVIFSTIILADLWKLGQMRPGDEINLLPVTADEASRARNSLERSIETLSPLSESLPDHQIYSPKLLEDGEGNKRIVYRQAGDSAILLEFGNDSFNIRTSFRIYSLLNAHEAQAIPGILELTAGVRALHVKYLPSISQQTILETLRHALLSLDTHSNTQSIPSRTIHLPLAFEHSSNAKDVQRYAQTIRPSAPWLPSNTEFLRRLNGLSSTSEINSSLLSSPLLILGLGDVFFGSPCAVPLDPRHRLFGMKYNPSRSYTTEGTVGIGGQYLCIYAIDSPGGYQLVGKTVPIWNRFSRNDKKWMFNIFDQISFYSITEEELNKSRLKGDGSELVRIEDGVFDLNMYETWLEENKVDIEMIQEKRKRALKECDAVAEALKSSLPVQPQQQSDEEIADIGRLILRAGVAGKCWKVEVKEGDTVEKGQTLFVIEAMKMEIKICSPCNGVCAGVFALLGDVLGAETRLASLSPV